MRVRRPWLLRSGGVGRHSQRAALRSVKDGPSPGRPYNPPIDVLFLCTGNICRSPMAEALLRERLADGGIEGTTASAGFLFDGRPAEDGAVRAMARRTIDIRDHRSRVVSEDLAGVATLILAMERRHVRQLAEFGDDVFAKSFTLPEFVRSAQVVGPRRPGQDPTAWIQRVGSSRRADSYFPDDRSEDIDDPMGRSRRAFRECADVIDRYLEHLVALAWPEPPPSDDHAVATPSSTGSL